MNTRRSIECHLCNEVMEPSHPDQNSNVKLYRVSCRCKQTGAISRASSLDTLEQAQKAVDHFNIRYAGYYDYFLEPVNPNSLSRQQLQTLQESGQLSLD